MRQPSPVVLVACQDYDRQRVEQAVRKGLAMLGGDWPAPGLLAGATTQPGPILLKPNMLRPAPAEKGVTTHPAVFSAVARCLQDKGVRLTFGDSPNGLFSPLEVARQSGLLAEAEALGIPLADFETGRDVSDASGGRFRRFPLARGILEASAVVNLPRLKTHSLTRMTGALKNMFGAVVGSSKAALHITHPDGESFGRMIADLNRLVRSRLVVMDAITVMEGNGPVSGRLADVGLLIVSADPVATDAVACRILGIDPLSIPFIRAAWESGLGAAREEEIEIRGADLAHFTGRGLAIPARNPTRAIPPFLWRVAKDLLVAKPAIDPAVCIACGECVASCPTSPKSLAQERGKVPSYNYSTCIRCYCCQETCPQGAISVRPAPLAWLLGGRAERKRGSRGA
ncbi:MAG: DUF362 domain-containing protein [Spirochaetes bacterium]|nr:DUF362 domain-containing protein [Spirochaetota bacterium]